MGSEKTIEEKYIEFINSPLTERTLNMPYPHACYEAGYNLAKEEDKAKIEKYKINNLQMRWALATIAAIPADSHIIARQVLKEIE